MIHLVLGGARSGKSTFAEQLAADSGKAVRYIATATGDDAEMQDRIARHQTQRPSHWTLSEQPLALAQLIAEQQGDELLLVDCLTLWLSNHLLHPEPEDLHQLQSELCEALQHCTADVVLVSNEVGQGIVPMGELSRRFVDHAGWLNQAVARVADHVTLISAGLPLSLKSPQQA